MLDKLTMADFIPLLNRQFGVSSESTGAVDMELVEVSSIGAGSTPEGDSGKRQPFSIVFLGAGQPVLPQGIYEVKHEEIGILNIFIVPVGPDEAGQGIRYEAVFN